MKPAFVAAITLTALVCFAPRCKAEQRPADIATSAQDQNPSMVTPPIANEKTNANDQTRADQSPDGNTIPQWVLIVVTVITAGFICWQAWETRKSAKAAADSVGAINRQTDHIARQAKSMRRQTTILRNNVTALIASERAWIDGEIVKLKIIEHTFYSLKITNHGRTPAQILSYEISHGLLTKGTEFSAHKLSTQITANDYVFLASGGATTLLEEFDMDELFATSEAMATGAFCVTIKYADVVSGEEGRQEGHETSFVYYYNTFLSSLERISTYNKYT